MSDINLLPIDIMKLLIDIYYTPIINSFIEENIFYCLFTYPSHIIKLHIPPCNYELGKSFARNYLYEDIEFFIEYLKQNVDGKIHMNQSFDFQIVLDKEYIHIIRKDDINLVKKNDAINIKIFNTKNSREQLINGLLSCFMIMKDIHIKNQINNY